MFVVGLTGGIGSGKSAASARFEELGIKVVDADIVAREVVEPDSPALKLIVQQFGEQVQNADASLNRAALRQIIFSDSDAKLWLEALLHPLIRSQIIQQLSQAHSKYAILVSPLLFEAKQYELCSRTLLIDASETLQKERASLRDNTTAEAIQKIIEVQMPRESKLQLASDIITNDGDIEHLNAQVDRMHMEYLKLAQSEKFS
jgi:dephospho-CoA kinase